MRGLPHYYITKSQARGRVVTDLINDDKCMQSTPSLATTLKMLVL